MPFGNGRGNFGGFGHGKGRFRGSNDGSFCVCSNCGKKVPHTRGVPCSTIKCPNCGVAMCRE